MVDNMRVHTCKRTTESTSDSCTRVQACTFPPECSQKSDPCICTTQSISTGCRTQDTLVNGATWTDDRAPVTADDKQFSGHLLPGLPERPESTLDGATARTAGNTWSLRLGSCMRLSRICTPKEHPGGQNICGATPMPCAFHIINTQRRSLHTGVVTLRAGVTRHRRAQQTSEDPKQSSGCAGC